MSVLEVATDTMAKATNFFWFCVKKIHLDFQILTIEFHERLIQ